MKDVVVVFILGFLLGLVYCYDRPKDKHACEGELLSLDCPRTTELRMLSANFGRTNRALCTPPNQTFNDTDCISASAKKIIYAKCHRKIFCSVLARSSDLGGDPCPGVRKYIYVIYKCVSSVVTTTQILPTTNYSDVLPKKNHSSVFLSKIDSTGQPAAEQQITTKYPIVIIFDENITIPNEKNIEASSKKVDRGFFHSMLVLVVLLKEKPKHSLLSMLVGVAAGTVIVLITVLVCVCVDKRRQKNESESFRDSDARKGEVIELEKSELLSRKKDSNTDSARSDDQVDSAFCDDEVDRHVSNDYESASDIAYLDAYLEEYNKNRSLPRPPVQGSDQNIGAQKMSRRAHNDGSKGRSYDYNSNSGNNYTTFA